MINTSVLKQPGGMKLIILLVVIALPGFIFGQGETKNKTSDDTSIAVYKKLEELKFTQKSIPIPTGGLSFKRENATWTLESGSLRLMEPTTDGRVTGLIFEGNGHFAMSIPHRMERAQLRRLTGKKDIESFDEPFTKMIIRTHEPLITELVKLPDGADYVKGSYAPDRHKVWLKTGRLDI
ncbi:MAG: hypothetical protein GY757_56145, partial [bacterium]|nr:hypothetical protein [bacterium]